MRPRPLALARAVIWAAWHLLVRGHDADVGRASDDLDVVVAGTTVRISICTCGSVFAAKSYPA